ncbi:MAG: aminopeptidase [Thiotrichales bacterium]|nr:aminopeptidase [Thiotrichales bacterium]
MSLAVLALTGCASVGYYAQSVTGHLGLMSRARPIETVVADPDTEPRLAARLRTALDIRDFASSTLGLPANASYRHYVDLDRRYVVWNVVAASELSLEPRRWCFPVAGGLSYRGYFSQSAATEHAAALDSEGWDVTVAGVRAYSTLGWFDDPLLSSMVDLPEYFLAGIVFHELAHQRLYVPGDTEFNESFAVVVERAGMRRWIEAAGRAELSEHYRVAADRRAAFLDVVRDTRRDLEAAYASSRPDSEKREAKARLFERLRSRYAALRATWASGPTYDFWFERGVNNAAIALLSTYDRWVPALEALLARSGGDLQAFYRASDELAALSPDERRAGLEALEPGDRPESPSRES